MEKLLFQPTYESEFAPQSAELTDYAETISVENEKLLRAVYFHISRAATPL